MADDHWMTTERDLVEEGPSQVARRTGVAAALGVAAFAAAAIPGLPLGIQMPVAAAGIAAAALLARPRSLGATDVALAAIALALAAMPAVRAAEWIAGIDLFAAAGLAVVVATRAVRWAEIFSAPVAVIAQLPAVPAFLRVRRPSLRGYPGAAPALRGASIGLLLVLVFGGLFASADRAFAEITSRFLIPDLDLGLLPARVVVFLGALLAVGTLARATRGATVGDDERGPVLRLPEWAIALSLLDLVFVAFVAVQVAVLFGGRTHVLETAGLGYAEYARQGFFQLLAVGGLSLAVVAAAVRWARRERPRDTHLLRILLAILCACTLVVLASALRRLELYESVFGYTRLRLSVHATILWMAAVFLLILAAGLRMRASWLPRATVLLTGASLLVFTLVDPDRLIAERNVQRYRVTGSIDLSYLSSLSADAVPALAELPPPLRGCALWEQSHLGTRALRYGGRWGEEAREYLHPLAWNYGRRRAAKYIPPRQPAAPALACHAAARMGLWP